MSIKDGTDNPEKDILKKPITITIGEVFHETRIECEGVNIPCTRLAVVVEPNDYPRYRVAMNSHPKVELEILGKRSRDRNTLKGRLVSEEDYEAFRAWKTRTDRESLDALREKYEEDKAKAEGRN